MASIDFTCQKCEGSFEIEATDLVDGTETLECPHCGAKPTKAVAEDFVNALGELLAQAAVLSKKFTLSLAVDTEDVADTADVEEEDEEADDEEEDDDEDDDDDDDGDVEDED